MGGKNQRRKHWVSRIGGNAQIRSPTIVPNGITSNSFGTRSPTTPFRQGRSPVAKFLLTDRETAKRQSPFQASGLKLQARIPQASSVKPRASSLRPQASRLKPAFTRLRQPMRSAQLAAKAKIRHAHHATRRRGRHPSGGPEPGKPRVPVRPAAVGLRDARL